MSGERRSLTLEDFWALRAVVDPRLAPNGAEAAYVVGTYDERKNEAHSAIWLAGLADGRARQFTAGTHADMQPRWSPDGRRLAFVSTRHEGKPQIFVIDRAGGEPRRLTSGEHGAHSPVWSPDGARICYTVDLPSDRQRAPQELAWFAAHAGAEQAGKVRRQTTLMPRFDGRGYIESRSHLFVLDLEQPDDEPRQLTEGDYDAGEAAWSPDGALIAFHANRDPEPEFTDFNDLWTIALADGALTRLTNSDLSLGAPCWSPDGHTIAFYAAPDLLQHGYGETHLWLVSREGGDARDVSAPLDRAYRFVQPDYQWPTGPTIAWSPDSGTVYFLHIDHGDGAIFSLRVGTGELRRLSAGPAVLCSVACTPDGKTLVALGATPTRPYDLFTLPAEGGVPTPLTHSNRELLDQIRLAPTERISFRGPGDLPVEGWLVRPADDAPRPYPLILHVHGGPYGAWGNTFYFQAQALAGLGYASFYVNPRGSLGYGVDFSRLADWGEDDFRDLLAGLDAVLARGEADPARIAITGISYGGFMTNWALGHSDRFAAGVSVNGVADHVSFYGTSDVSALWYDVEFGGPYWASEEQLRRYWHHSPLSAVDRIEAPLLLLQAENDYRCPIEQGEQIFTALRMRRRVVELIRFPGASHVIAASGTPLQRYLQWKLALDWFETYLS